MKTNIKHIKNIPKYRYPLYEKWDRDCYNFIVKLVRQKRDLKILGKKEEINQFLKLLIQSQKMDNWRKFLKIVLKSIYLKQINTTKILKQKFPIPKGYGRWVIFREHKEISDFLDNFEKKNLQFIGNNKEIVEFVLRYILAQLLLEWKSSIYAMKEIIGNSLRIRLRLLNKVLSEFDYTNVFDKN